MKACVLFFMLWLSPAAQAADTRTRLQEVFGLKVVDAGGPADWREFELEQAWTVLSQLPAELATVAKRTPVGVVRLAKSYAAPRSPGVHLAPWALNLQVILFLEDAAHLAGKISSGDLSYDERAQYLLCFKRKLVHHLLHLYDSEKQFSHSPSWRSISGWRYREYLGIRLPFVREALNQDPRNYTRESGLQSPEEDFATFGEFFFVDEEKRPETSVRCRIPDKYQFFRSIFPAFIPFAETMAEDCPSPGKDFFDDIAFLDPITRRPISMGAFTSDQVEGFELLYATPGVNDAAEIAGHLILRVKLRNNPEATRLGIENPNDLVISFLADTESDRPPQPAGGQPRSDAMPHECRDTWFDFGQAVREDQDAMRSIFQALKGLSGGFLTVYDRQTLYQAVKTYTVDQDRNLLRYKLTLSQQQKEGLIRRLYVAKQNFKSKYYFFDRNCASILMQVIGEGIGDREVAEFDPFVVPPNSLVALLIRKGLAVQTFPSFYSYRKKGYIAQEEIRGRVSGDFPRSGISPAAILSAKEADRLVAWKGLVTHVVAAGDFAAEQHLYQLASLGQDAELSWQDRAQRCENYTSSVSQYLRQVQRDLLRKHGGGVAAAAVDTNVLINEKFQGEESLDARTGSQNTQLSSLGAGLVSDGTQYGHLLHYAVHKQEAGSVASQAMQRGTAVQLGEFRFDRYHANGDRGPRFAWQLTGLEIRKFKERLYDVPSYFSGDGKIGLGLSLLKLRKDSRYDYVNSTLAGGAILFNLISSRLYLDYLFVSVGADADVLWRTSRTLKMVPDQTALVVPVRAESLLTFGSSRLWQLRASHQLRIKRIAGQDFQEQTSLVAAQYRLPERLTSEFLLSVQAARFQSFADSPAGGAAEFRYSLGIEWNRW